MVASCELHTNAAKILFHLDQYSIQYINDRGIRKETLLHGIKILIMGNFIKKKGVAVALFQGVNVVEYCKCEGFTDCSTQWDPYDGKSITQAQSDQYKVGIFTCKMIEIISKRRYC